MKLPVGLLVAPFRGSESIRTILAPGKPILVSTSITFPRMTWVGVWDNEVETERRIIMMRRKILLITRYHASNIILFTEISLQSPSFYYLRRTLHFVS
jgi:hypothetical protein